VKFDVEIPPGVEERAHRVAMAAFAERRPAPKRRSYWRPAVAIVVVAAAAGILASPPGRSVIHSIREAVGVENAKQELFSLPAPGRLLVESPRGPWVVNADGSRRLLGDYREASWSPFGRFVVARRGDELVTMEPKGRVHWTLSRPDLRLPAWGGKRDDTRIAYLSRSGLRVVAGDGTGDTARCADRVSAVAPAWRPGSLSVLAFSTRNGFVVYDTTNCRRLFRRGPMPTKLQWSADGTLLLAVSGIGLDVYDANGHVVAESIGVDDATFVGETHEVAVLRNGSAFVLGSAPLFRATGLRQIVSSPDGQWLLLTWPAANQWVFVRVAAPHRLSTVSGITRQFGGDGFPNVSGWVK